MEFASLLRGYESLRIAKIQDSHWLEQPFFAIFCEDLRLPQNRCDWYAVFAKSASDGRLHLMTAAFGGRGTGCLERTA